MDSQTIFAALRDALAALYSEEQDARVISADAGLDTRQIAFSSRAQTNWHNILAEAIRQNRLDALLDRARNEYLDNPALAAAYTHYRRFIEQGQQLTAQPQLPISGDVITTQIGDQASVVAVGKNIHQVVYQQVKPATLDAATLAAAHARLAQLPVDDLPPLATLPPGSRMPFSANPLFVGRESDLQTLVVALKGGTTVAVSQIAAATGLGGIGKTQLAVAFVHHCGCFFAGGVYWLNFADPGAIPTEIAACGALMPDLRVDFATLDLPTQVRLVLAAWQSPLPRLLVFDNCEDPALLAQWRPPTGGSRILVTSRRRSWDAALGVHLLTLDTLPRAHSLALLHKFRPDLPTADPQLDAIAAELGDLPLALHLAGSYLARYRQARSPAQYLAQLRQPALLQHRSLQAGDLSPTGHVQHVARTFALSYERLNPAHPPDALALALLARAAWFAPGQPIPRALLLACLNMPDGEESALELADALAQLVDLGLLEETATGDLLTHRLVVHFVQQSAGESFLAVQRAVAVTLWEKGRQINKTRTPAAFLSWQTHLRHITDLIQNQAKEEAAGLCNVLGNQLQMMGDNRSARPYNERALAIREAILGDKHPDTAVSLNDLGVLLDSIGEYTGARHYHERALAIREEVLGTKHPDTTDSLSNLGVLLYQQGDYEAARPYYERALAIDEEVFGAKHPNIALDLINLGLLLQAQGDLVTARLYLEHAESICKEVLGNKHPDTANCFNSLGQLLQTQGDLAAAQVYLEHALAIREEVEGTKHPHTAESLNALGYLLQAQGDSAAARRYFERALAILEERLGSDHPHTRTVRNNLAALADLGA